MENKANAEGDSYCRSRPSFSEGGEGLVKPEGRQSRHCRTASVDANLDGSNQTRQPVQTMQMLLGM